MKIINLNKTKQSKLTFNKPGDYTVYFENLSGDFVFDIVSPNVNLNIYGLFIGKNNERFKVHTIQNHKAELSTSNLLIKGVFYDQCKFIYEGLVRIEKKAQKSHAYQKNQNLIMSDRAYVDSRPFLEILANDVFCTHGSTTGRLNKEEIYYLNSRGISESHAEKLLIEGFIGEIRNKVDG